jgi:hypothetical protein
MNYIDEKRKEIKKFFDPELIIPNSKDSITSPSKNFRLDTVEYKQNQADINWEVTKVEITDLGTNQMIFNFFVNDSRFFYSWIEKDNIEYLICAEDLFGGQTIIDLTNRKMSSYSPNEDGFIWTDFHLSPDQKILATTGCYWACPYIIKLYDFNNPLLLPLAEIKEIELIDNNEIIIGWLDNETLQLSQVEFQTVRENFDDGTFRYMVVSNPIGEKREINIKGIPS